MALGTVAPGAATGAAPLFFMPGAVLDALIDSSLVVEANAEDDATDAGEESAEAAADPATTTGDDGSVDADCEADASGNENDEESAKKVQPPPPKLDAVEPVNGLVAVLATESAPLPARFAALRALISACTLRGAAATTVAADARLPGALVAAIAHPAAPVAAKAARLAALLAANAQCAAAMLGVEAPAGADADADAGAEASNAAGESEGEGEGEGAETAASPSEGESEGAADTAVADAGEAKASPSCAIVSALEANAGVRASAAAGAGAGASEEAEDGEDGESKEAADDGAAATGARLLGAARVLEAVCSAGAVPPMPAARIAVRALSGALGAERASAPPIAQTACADALRALVRAAPELAGDVLRADVGADAVPPQSAGVLALCRKSLEYEWVEYSEPPKPKKKTLGLLSAVVAKKLPEPPADASKVNEGPCGQPEVQVALLRLCGTLLAMGGAEVDDAFEVMAKRKAPKFAEVLELALTEHEVDTPKLTCEDDGAEGEGEGGDGADGDAGSGGGEGEGTDGADAEDGGDAAEARAAEDDDSSDDEPPPPPPPPQRRKVSASAAVRLAALEALACGCMHPCVREQLRERAETALPAAAAAGALPGGPLVSEHLAVVVETIGGGVSVLADLAKRDRAGGAAALSGAARRALHTALLALPDGDALAPPRPPPRPPSPPPAPPPVRFSRSLARMRRARPRRPPAAVGTAPEAEAAAA